MAARSSLPVTATASEHSVVCPLCGETLRTLITTTLLPGSAALKDFFAGKLNCPQCPHCGGNFPVDVSLIYRDAESVFIAFLLELPEDGDTRALEQEVDCLATDISLKEETERPTVRLCFTRSELIEKIALRQSGYDDRLIEYAKFQLFKSIPEEKLNQNRHRLLFDYSNQDEDKLVFIVFDREENEPLSQVHVPSSDYQALRDEFLNSPELMLELDTLFASCYVSCERLMG
jgi:hypothetical protein